MQVFLKLAQEHALNSALKCCLILQRLWY